MEEGGNESENYVLDDDIFKIVDLSLIKTTPSGYRKRSVICRDSRIEYFRGNNATKSSTRLFNSRIDSINSY